MTQKRIKNETGLEIAVIGMAGRFPGARNIDEFWNNLKNGVESISFFSTEELEQIGENPGLFNHPGYVKAIGGAIENAEYFDSTFFDYIPTEAEVMDPQFRVFHECAWEALESAGYEPFSYDGSIGLYAGASYSLYWQALLILSGKSNRLGQFDALQLINRDFLCSRVSYKLNLQGPSLLVQSACSTSLVAIHMACRALLTGECDIALAGGVALQPWKSGYIYQEGAILSPDGHCRAFSADSKGTVGGNGVGIVVLKKLKNAVAHRDSIAAVIKGTAINNDGIRRVGFTAPSIEGQADVIERSLYIARVEPGSIGYIETHGTGTPLGDTVEVEALKLAFNHSGKKNFCALGAVKSNIGHLDAAAGVTGFIKTVLALKHRLIPPSLHVETTNPGIDFENSPFYVNTTLSKWKNDTYPLRAGVSSFGIGGTNAHVILEEAPIAQSAERKAQSAGREYQLILLSARTQSALDTMTEKLTAYLKKNPGVNLADVAYTLQVGRREFKHRKMMVCSTVQEAIQTLATGESGKTRTLFLKKETEHRPIVFMFPGLGAQYTNMGRELYQKEPVFQEEMNRCFEILKPLLDYDIKDILYPTHPAPSGHPSQEGSVGARGGSPCPPQDCVGSPGQGHQRGSPLQSAWPLGTGDSPLERGTPDPRNGGGVSDINQFEIGQLVIFMVEYALAKLLMAWGITPTAMIGYSFGEYVAACISGVFSLEDALKLVVWRGRLIKEIPGGAMLSVPLPAEKLKPLLGSELSLAIDNGPSGIVSGSTGAVFAFEKQMKEKRYLCMRLPVSHALHSTMMAPILKTYEEKVSHFVLNKPQIPYISNVTGGWISVEEAADPGYWGKHLMETVQFGKGISQLTEEPNTIFLEIGPGRDLTNLVQRNIDDHSNQKVINFIRPHDRPVSDQWYLLNRIGQLWLHGKPVNGAEFYSDQMRHRVSLPTYSFERLAFPFNGGIKKIFSIPGIPGMLPGRTQAPVVKELADWFYIPSWTRIPAWKPSLTDKPSHIPTGMCWLIFLDTCGLGQCLGKYLGKKGQVLTVKAGTTFQKKNKTQFVINPRIPGHYDKLLTEIKRQELLPGSIIHLWGVTGDNQGTGGNGALDMEPLDKAQDLGFYSLINIARAIGKYDIKKEIRIAVITDNLQEVTGEEKLQPQKATVLGAVKVIPVEYSNIYCHSIDVSPGAQVDQVEQEKLVNLLIDQLLKGSMLPPSSVDQVTALRGSHCWKQVFEPLRLEKSGEKGILIKERGVYLVTGGLGGIGLALAEYLAKQVRAKLVLIARTQLPPRDKWNQVNHELKTKIQKVKALEEWGAEILVVSADVTDPLQVRAVIDRTEKHFGPINGVIHSAGVHDGQLIQFRNRETSERIFAAKLLGTLVLDRLLKTKPLDFFIICSSLNSFLPGLGQVGYCAANAFLDAFVISKNSQNARGGLFPFILSINWDRWQHVGIAVIAEETHKKLTGKDLKGGITKEQGLEAFHRILANPQPLSQVVVAASDLETMIENAKNVRLSSLWKEADNVTPDRANHSLPRPNLDTEYIPPGNEIEKKIVPIWQGFFGFEPVGIHDDFFELGGDSLKAITMISRIHKKLNVVVPLTEFFNNSTIETLCQYINGAEKTPYSSIDRVEKREYYRLTPAQKRLYFLQEMYKDSTAYNELQAVSLAGSLDRQKLEQTVRQLIERHESFRTSIHMVKEEPMQKIHDEVEIRIEYYTHRQDSPGRNEIKGIINDFLQPFDLSRAPFLKVGLIEVGTHRHILMINQHHIITDGVSHDIFVKEFSAFSAGEELPRLRLHYKDYAEWLNSPPQQTALEQEEVFWLDQFQGEIPVLNLPCDYARPAVQSFEGKNVGFVLDREKTQRLKNLAAKEGGTLFVVLLAVYNLVLAKISGQSDVIVGTGVAGRRHPDLHHIMGIFVNTLAIRNYPQPGKTFTTFLKEVKDSTLSAFENQEYPFEVLVEKVDIRKDTSRNPLFDVMLMLQNYDMITNETHGADKPSQPTPGPTKSPLEIKPYGYDSSISKFDLTLFVEEANSELRCYFEYCTKLFKPETIQRFITYFKEIAFSAAASPNKSMREIAKVSGERREKVIHQLNRQLQTEAEELVDAKDSLQQMLTRSFKTYHHSTAIEYGKQTLTYSELDHISNYIAHWIGNKGIPEQTSIGVLLENRLDLIAVMLGILKARCIFVPLDSSYPQHRLETMVAAIGLPLIILDSANFEQWPGEGITMADQPVELIHQDHLFPKNRRDQSPDRQQRVHWFDEAPNLSHHPEDSIYIYFTSGTTGTPRAMLGKNKSLLHFVRWEIETFGVNESFRFSQLTTPVFDAFLRDILVPLGTGGVICIPLSKEILLDSRQLIDWVDRSSIYLIHCVPGLFRRLTSSQQPSHAPENQLKTLKYILLSGERINPSDLVDWYGTFGERTQLVNLWGTSETTLAKTCYFVQPSDIHRDRVPVGKPLPGARVVVLDENLEICDPLVIGQLYIKTPFRTSGYLNEPELTNQRFIPDPFTRDTHVRLHSTGDLGQILLDGNIDVIGRNDRQVKIRGIRVELEEIESVFTKNSLVSEAVALEKEISTDDETGELLCVYISLTAAAKQEEQKALSTIKAYVSDRLPGYMVPGKLITVESIPRKPSGKVDYDVLPHPLAEDTNDFQAPRDEVETKLLHLWIDILRIENISVTQSFFELGGNSLNIMTLISQIHRDFDVRIALGEIFNSPTIRQQADIIRASGVDTYIAIEPMEKRDYYPQTSAQKRLFFLDKFDEVSTGYNMPGVFKVKGKINKRRYQEAFGALIARHQNLRTSFEITDNEPIQRVHPVQELEFAPEYSHAQGKKKAESIIRDFIKPFDLSKAPLLRVGFVEMAAHEHLLLIDMHHIISDGTSMRILPNDFIKLYNGQKLPPLKIQYKDFSLWQNHLLGTGLIKTMEEYWLNIYRGEIPRLNLPIDYQPPEVFTFEGDKLEFTLGHEETSRLRQMCAQHHVTLFMNLLAAFNVLLFKHSGQEDIIVGCDIAGRPHADLQDIIGMFVNMLAMRNHPRSSITYLEFLNEVKENSLKAFENQDLQFETLVEQLNLERNPAKNPLFDVEFLFRDIDRNKPFVQRSHSEAFIPYGFENKTSKFDMALEAYEMTEVIVFQVEYYTKLFRRETIRLFADHLVNILRTIIKKPGIPLAELEIMSPKERQQLLIEFNQTRKDFETSKNFPQLFREQAALNPDKIAVVYRKECISYAHLDEESNRLANYLCREKSIRRGDRVAVFMDRSTFFLTALMGILKAGGVYVPLVPSLPEERIKKMIDDARIQVVISREKYLRSLDRLQWQCKSFSSYLCLDSWDIYSQTPDNQEEWLNQEKLWEYIGETAVDDVTGGGWLTSYTGEPFTRQEMDEYGDNALKKLMPILNPRMRVLEIGCASGITMYRVAPKVGFYYGTDFSRVIIRKNKERVKAEGHENIALACLAAHEIDKIQEKDFDLIILNSVIQSFHGHNYLVRVLRKAIHLLKEEGFIFAGDIMNLDLKEELIHEMMVFKKKNRENITNTKTDFSEELFLSPGFFEDLTKEIPGIRRVEFSDKIYTIENELTKFRYDVMICVDKTQKSTDKAREKRKYQHDLRALARWGNDTIAANLTPDDLAYIIYTSGTTGQPKGVMIHHQGMLNHLYAKIHDLSITSTDIIAQTASASFDISVWQFLAGLLPGGTTVVIDKEVVLEPRKFLRQLQEKKVTILESVPSLMTALLEILEYDNEIDKELKHLRWMIPTGEALAVHLVREWYRYYPGIKLVNAYGPTEASDDVTHYVVADIPPENQKTIPIGKPLQNLHIYILDENLSLCPIRVRGEICVAGIGVGKGYWKDPSKTAKAFVPNPYGEGGDKQDDRLYRTGDIGFWREDGNIECLGRMDQQVKIRGNRIELGEIENRLIKHDDIKEAVLMARETSRGEDKYLCAYIVSEKPPEPKELIDYLSVSLPDYMIPSYFVPLERIPLTPNGKINRNALPEPGVEEIESDYTPPQNKAEKQLAEIWSEILGIDKDTIGIDENFFQLGGHSLRATQMNTRIHKKLNVKVPLAEIFKSPTIRELSEYITLAVKDIHESIKPVEKREYYAQSSAQKRLFSLDQFEDIGTGYNMPYAFSIRGEVKREQYEKSFKILIQRHESLRTSLAIMNKEPVQILHDHVDFEIQEISIRDNEINHQIIKGVTKMFIQPFDLSKAPLVRVGLLKLAEEEHLLLVDMHHIIGDGTSVMILTDEFIRILSGESLPPLNIQYKDFTIWQNHLFISREIKEQEEYWLNLYSDVDHIPSLNLPTDYPRKEIFTFEGAAHNFKLEAEDTINFRALGTEHDATLFMNLLAAFNVLLHRYTRQEDIIVGCGIAGRPHTDLQHIIGMFVNTLAIRNYPEGEKTYLEFLKEVKDNCINALENQDMQFEELVERVSPGRASSKNPFFNVELNVQNYDLPLSPKTRPPAAKSNGARMTHYGIEHTTSKFDMIVFATEIGDEIYFMVEYSTALFKPSSIEKMAQRLIQVIRQVVENKTIKLKNIKISHELIEIQPVELQTEFGL